MIAGFHAHSVWLDRSGAQSYNHNVQIFLKVVNMSQTGTPDIRAMFDRIAPTYDLLNKVMSAGVDRRWRERAIAELGAIDGKVFDL